MKLDANGVLLTCGSCGTTNRLGYKGLDRATRCAKCHADLPRPNQPIDVPGTQEFDAVVANASVPIVVDFWAAWCGPCRMVAPELQKVAARNAGRWIIAKVNTDLLPDLGERFGIRSIPTLAVFSGGREVTRTSGARPADDVERFIEQATLARQ